LPKDTVQVYFLYRDAPEEQRYVSDRLGRRAVVEGRWITSRKSGWNVHL